MDRFIQNFVREAPGVWTCKSYATLVLDTGRIQVAPGTRLTRGTLFMGIELARLLEEQFEKSKGNLGPR